MNSQQLGELCELKICLSRLTVIDRDDFMGLFCDYIHNGELQGALKNSYFSEAVAYCYTYKNCDRVAVLNKLYEWLVAQQGLRETEAKSMTEIALYVGGIDGQINDISSLIQNKASSPTSSSGSDSSSISGAETSNGSSSNHHGQKSWLWIVSATLALFVVLFLIGKCGKEQPSFEEYSLFDICRFYEGTIDLEKSKSYKMGVGIKEGREMKAVVTNIYNPKDVSTYTCVIKNGELVLTDGPNLQINKTSKGTIVLSCDHDKYGKWFFKSK